MKKTTQLIIGCCFAFGILGAQSALAYEEKASNGCSLLDDNGVAAQVGFCYHNLTGSALENVVVSYESDTGLSDFGHYRNIPNQYYTDSFLVDESGQEKMKELGVNDILIKLKVGGRVYCQFDLKPQEDSGLIIYRISQASDGEGYQCSRE